MHDRENVISEIEDALSDNLAKAGHIYGLSLVGLKDKALADALALLKEQDAVEPILDSFLHKRCPLCRTLLKGKYCHECGQAVKWE